MAQLATKTAKLPNGEKLPYVEQGDSAGIAVVFLHGFADSWHSFELVLPHIPGFIHAFALTQRGHGDATKPRTGYAVGDLVADLSAFMDTLGIARGVIVGHSMGSAVARAFAANRPNRVLGLVLLGASATSRGTKEARKYWDAELAKLPEPVDEGFVRGLLEESVVQSVPPIFFETQVEEAQKVPAFVWREAVQERWRSKGDPEELGRITAPTLICWGDRDPRYPRSDQESLATAITNSRLVVYPGAGHALHWEEPERFASDLVVFVRDLANE